MSPTAVELDASGGAWLSRERVLVFAVDPIGLSQGALFSDELSFSDRVREAVARRSPNEVVLIIPTREQLHCELELPLEVALAEVGPGRLDAIRYGHIVVSLRESADSYSVVPGPDRRASFDERSLRLGTFGR